MSKQPKPQPKMSMKKKKNTVLVKVQDRPAIPEGMSIPHKQSLEKFTENFSRWEQSLVGTDLDALQNKFEAIHIDLVNQLMSLQIEIGGHKKKVTEDNKHLVFSVIEERQEMADKISMTVAEIQKKLECAKTPRHSFEWKGLKYNPVLLSTDNRSLWANLINHMSSNIWVRTAKEWWTEDMKQFYSVFQQKIIEWIPRKP